MQKNNYGGDLNLLAIPGTRIVKHEGRIALLTDIEDNPAIFFKQSGKNGQPICKMNIRVVEKNHAENDENTHFVAMSINKKKLQELQLSEEEVKKKTPIIGNLKLYKQKNDFQEIKEEVSPYNEDPVGDIPQEFIDDLPPEAGW